MKEFNLSNLFIPLLAAVAIFVPLSGTLSMREAGVEPNMTALLQATPTPSLSPTPRADSGRVQGEAARLLCEFFGFRPVPDAQPSQGKPGSAPQQSFEAKSYQRDYCRILPSLRAYNPQLEIDYLIATIPDPKDSRLNHLFDYNLDAIQRAIEAAGHPGDTDINWKVEATGYNFDRYFLPWDRTRASSSDTAQATRNSREPGVILYRNYEKKTPRKPAECDGIAEKTTTKLLLLFLIGETPTSGIQKTALQNALLQINQIAGWRNSSFQGANVSNISKLRIVGPSFSGSAPSLASTLHGWLENLASDSRPEIEIVSGSATAIDKTGFEKQIGGGKVRFHSTVIADQAAKDAFIGYLARRDPKLTSETGGAPGLPYIAWLTEANTAYGQSTATDIQGKKSRRENRDKDREQQGTRNDPRILSLTFPLHISQLRAEAAKTKQTRNNTTPAVPVSDPNISLPMGDVGDPGSKDVIPAFSSLETVTSEQILEQIFSLIDRERIRYIGLTSTDIQDRIFLVREIRKHCPNAVIFIFSAELIYLHSEANIDFQGSLIISPYPLFELNQLWTYPFRGYEKRLQFATQSSQGFYNATLAVMDRPDLMLEYGEPFETYRVGQERRPAFWLSIVGRNGIWPVETLQSGKENTIEQEPGSTGASGGTPAYTFPAATRGGMDENGNNPRPRSGLNGTFVSVLGLGLLLAIGFVCLIPPLVMLDQLLLYSLYKDKGDQKSVDGIRRIAKLFGKIKHGLKSIEDEIEKEKEQSALVLLRWIRRGWLGQTFSDEPFYRYRFDRRIYLISCTVALLIVSLFISGVAVLPGWMSGSAIELESEWGRHWVIRIGAYAVLAFTLITFGWLVYSIFHWIITGWRHLRGDWWAFLTLAVGATMVTLVIWGLVEIINRDNVSQKVFFFLRATDITNGVSLLLPAMLIGLAGFLSLFAAVRRLNLAERMPCLREPQQEVEKVPQFLRFDHEGAASFKGLKALENRVKELIISRYCKVPGAVIVALLFLLIYVRLFAVYYIPSVDGRRFDWYFMAAFYLAPMLLVWAFLRFVWLWIALRKLLRRLSWHPLFTQYAASKSEEDHFKALPQIDLMAATPTYTALSLSVEQVRRFYRVWSESTGETDPKMEDLVDEAEEKLSTALDLEAAGKWQDALTNRRESQEKVAELTEHVTAMMEKSWITNSINDSGENPQSWQDAAKFFLITHVVAFLQHVFAHLKNLVALVTMGLLLILFAANSYPFQPREPLLIFSWVTILTAVAVTLFVFVQMSRDKVLSLISGTTPGRLTVTRDLVIRILMHGVIPIVALLGAQFPEALREIFSWLSLLEGRGH